ncbi:hypothetical protein [Photobacterium damselae]|uniref:hypothetical protein n=1 Tax=Photobacterium damselae TaxID=38293 RepID=UPI000D666908|nr:hypothetical protein [Photobacterium damselae]AWK84548.1 hypothetical protein BST98_21170 [Photobacterium damselae]MBE8127819.1 hypothetical protein [Photobacterium damselae subsp. piscicida]MCG3823437.1 hypothetical protein [Photobacterium damselae]TLS89834.1 hypothetical protein FD720_01310 [Photobacterium damselae subsp. damselae]WIH21839.1 hypothetical protein KQY33_20610 [Photobacterium damselae]
MGCYSLIDFAHFNGIETYMSVVKVQPLPSELRSIISYRGFAKSGRCFDNSWNIVTANIVCDAKYVLAISQKVLPVQHAIIKVGNIYYDPTWELNQTINDIFDYDNDYLVIAEWDRLALHDFVRKNQSADGNYYAPMLSTIKHLRKDL